MGMRRSNYHIYKMLLIKTYSFHSKHLKTALINFIPAAFLEVSAGTFSTAFLSDLVPF